MSKVTVLLEVVHTKSDGMEFYRQMVNSTEEFTTREAENIVKKYAGFGLEVQGSFRPTPMFFQEDRSKLDIRKSRSISYSRLSTELAAFSTPEKNVEKVPSPTTVIVSEVEASKLADLEDKARRSGDMMVWPCSELELCNDADEPEQFGMPAKDARYHDALLEQQKKQPAGFGLNPTSFGLNPTEFGFNVTRFGYNPTGFGYNTTHSDGPTTHASLQGVHPVGFGLNPRTSDGRSFVQDRRETDCRPFRPGVSMDEIRSLLGVSRVWNDGFQGQNVVVGILDTGINGDVYPVVGGYENVRVGTASIRSHGSMCAADVLVAAPLAKFYDYPFLGNPNSGTALQMFQSVLDHRQEDGTPHLTNNSYAFTRVPSKEEMPHHEVHDINHPFNRKVLEVIISGAPAFFAAGNCGENCPSGNCHRSSIGRGRSIHGANSLAEVITVAACNSRQERIGYSSQGPGMFESEKPDLTGYSHFFGNFGPNRPAGTATQPFDNGTSAAAPLVAGVGALLLSAFPNLTSSQLKNALLRSATNIGPAGFDYNTGNGVVNACAAYTLIGREWWMDGALED